MIARLWCGWCYAAGREFGTRREGVRYALACARKARETAR